MMTHRDVENVGMQHPGVQALSAIVNEEAVKVTAFLVGGIACLGLVIEAAKQQTQKGVDTLIWLKIAQLVALIMILWRVW